MTSLWLAIALMIGATLGFVAGELDAVEQMLEILHRYGDSLGLPRDGRPSLMPWLLRHKEKGESDGSSHTDRSA